MAAVRVASGATVVAEAAVEASASSQAMATAVRRRARTTRRAALTRTFLLPLDRVAVSPLGVMPGPSALRIQRAMGSDRFAFGPLMKRRCMT